jgi:hypothetical protein
MVVAVAGVLGLRAKKQRQVTNAIRQADDFRIREIHLGADQQMATIISELRVNNAWAEQKASRWKRVDKEWWLVIE